MVTHETRFEGGYLKCSCGWLSRKLLWNIAAVDAEAERHLAAVQP